MERIAEFIFEAAFLKHIPRSGYQFLGVGRESIAEHTYAATLIGFVLSRLEPTANAERLITMCLMHDLLETRIGDLNYVQKKYVHTDEAAAVEDAWRDLPFAVQLKDLISEFNAAESLEARLAHDADQLALVVDLQKLNDMGYPSPRQWLPHVQGRLKTPTAKELVKALRSVPTDRWWLRIFS